MAGIFKIQIRVNNTNVGNFGKRIKCTECVMKGLQNFKHTSYTFYDQQQLQD